MPKLQSPRFDIVAVGRVCVGCSGAIVQAAWSLRGPLVGKTIAMVSFNSISLPKNGRAGRHNFGDVLELPRPLQANIECRLTCINAPERIAL